MERKGLDISAYQKGINFDKFNGVEFLILRAGFTGYGGTGTNKNKDSQFENFYNQAKARGIPVGAYWYSCANTYEKGRAEAEFMFENCLKGKQFEYPIYIDVEENRWQRVGKSIMNQAIKGFCEFLEAKGYYVGIYASTYWFNTYIDTANLKQYDKWLANWSSKKPTFKYGSFGLWQNSSDGSQAGMRVDTNIAYEDYPAIMKKYGLNGYPKQNSTDPTPAPQPAPVKKTTDEIAKEVINGQWGNGDERKRRIAEAGYDYATIQARVNEMLGVKKQEPAKRYHTIAKGDTLYGIAKKYYGNGNRYPEIAKANGIKNPNVIHVGQKIIIP